MKFHKLDIQLLSIFTVFSIIYISTLSHAYSGDSIIYQLLTERQLLVKSIDVHHLLLEPINILFYRLWLFFGWKQGAMIPLQVLNALGAAGCVALFHLILHNISDNLISPFKKGAAIILFATTASYGFAGSIWLLATEAEFVLPALLPALLAMAVLTLSFSREKLTPLILIYLGLLTAFAILYYLTHFFLLPVISLGIVLFPSLALKTRIKSVLVFLATVLIVVSIPLGIIFMLITNYYPNALHYFFGGNLYGTISWENIPRGVYAFLRSIALFPGLGMNDRTLEFISSATSTQLITFAMYYFTFLIIGIAPITLILRNKPNFPLKIQRILTIYAFWALIQSIFAFYWVPSDISFWIIPLTVWFLYLGIALSFLYTHSNNKKYVIAISVSFAIMLLTLNSIFIILPHRFS